MRQFCFSPSSIDRRCFSEEQVWLNGRDRLNSATHSAYLLFLPLFFSLPPRITRGFCDSRARVLFARRAFLEQRQQGRSRSTRLITGDPSDGGHVLLDYVSSSGHSGHLRDPRIQRKSGTSPTSIGNRFSFERKKKTLYLSCCATTRVTFFSDLLF